MLRDSLRRHTLSHHERIELALGLPQSVRSKTHYLELLIGFHGFYMPHENRLSHYGTALARRGVDLFARMKTHKLRSDMRAMGLSDECLEGLPLCVETPSLTTEFHALGSLYVLEGATLGGQLIARALHPVLNLSVDSEMQFFSGYGRHTASMWRAFVESLDAAVLEPNEIDAALHGAAQTFSLLERWMTSSVKFLNHRCG